MEKTPLTIKWCKFCKRVHRFGEWVKLSTQDGIELYGGKYDLTVIDQECDDCAR